MKHILIGIIVLFMVPMTVSGQASGYAWGIQGGPSFVRQNWESRSRSVAVQYHADLYIDSYNEGDPNSLYASIGYHVRGSADKRNFYILNGNWTSFAPNKYLFYNISAELGVKKRVLNDNRWNPYYGFGLRAEYTIKTNLNVYNDLNDQFLVPVYASDVFVRPFNYGISFVGGMEFPLAELYEGFASVRISQDFSRQYYQPAIPGVITDQYGNMRSLGEINARNTSIELSVGIRIFRIRE